jgi:hypothetical protein
MRVMMLSPQTESLRSARNTRLQAERDRNFRAQLLKARRMLMLGAIVTVVVLGQLWLSGCSFAQGCGPKDGAIADATGVLPQD